MNYSKKKIAFVISSLSSGGAERVISNLSNELIHNFDVIIITFSGSEPFYKLDESVKVISCFKTIDKPKNFWQSLYLNYKLYNTISKTLRKECIDLAIGFITSANILTTLAAKRNGIPVVICERNNPLLEEVPKFWKILREYVYPMTNALVLQTEGIKSLFSNIKPNRIWVLANPISKELTTSRNELVRKENLILSVGRLDENKNHKDIITAFNLIDNTNWKLLIIGEGNKKNELIELIKTHKLESQIDIISKVTDVETYYNSASIFVFASKSEGFPNALLEAMHFGVPCISTNCDFGPSDLINDGQNGYLVPVHELQELKDKLYHLMEDKETRKRFSEAAKRSTDRYRSEIVVAKWEELINSLLLP